MFRLRRRKGQGAIEYLFMIAAALVIILIAVRYVSQSGSQATNQGDLAMLQSQVETIKAQLEAQEAFDTAKVPVDTQNKKYVSSGGTEVPFSDLYDLCTKGTTDNTDLDGWTREQACRAIVDWWNGQ